MSTLTPQEVAKLGNNLFAIGEVWKNNLLPPDHPLAEFKSVDHDVLKMKQSAFRLASCEYPVLITGESGTGKELVAKILHLGRVSHPFVDVNTCAVTETLFESELFGHVKGAFTGATTDRVGLIEQAGEGTLFLDEIGDMPLHLQSKLLRVIQNQTYRRVGSNTSMPVKCRIVAATHRNMREMILSGHFRLDLYERINVFNLHIKPLRDRRKDIDIHLTGDLFTQVRDLVDSVVGSKLIFPGNVRQLLNLKLRASVLGVEHITLEDIQ